LLEAAKHVLKRLKGHLPRTVKQLMEIPGIGRYTAGKLGFHGGIHAVITHVQVLWLRSLTEFVRLWLMVMLIVYSADFEPSEPIRKTRK
jgi:hypothetical protein